MAKKTKQQQVTKKAAAPAPKAKPAVKKVSKKQQREEEQDEDELNQDTLRLEEYSSDSDSDDNEDDEEAGDFGGFSSTDEEDGDEEEEEDEEEEKSKKNSKEGIEKTKKRQQDDDNEKDKSDEKSTKKAKIQHTVTPINKASSKKSEKITKLAQKHKRGILYIGRLPKGFDEPELAKYFSQFGQIVNLRVARNRKTGNSKHYGFIEFENYEVAKIAQETMNNYLIFNHLLKCQLVEKADEEGNINNEKLLQLFKNSNKKFKRIPWAKVSKDKFEKPKSEEKWSKLEQKSQRKQSQRTKKLKEAGFNFELVK